MVLVSVFGTLLPLHPWLPLPPIPLVIAFGVDAQVSPVRGAATAFVLGYEMDLFTGNPMGLYTFVCVALMLLTRSAGLRLSLRSRIAEMLLVFGATLVALGMALALRVIFEPPAPFPLSRPWPVARELLAPSITTALLAPPILALQQRLGDLVERRSGRQRTS